jgi:hypothetical protein
MEKNSCNNTCHGLFTPPPPPPTKIPLKKKDVKYFLVLGMAATFSIEKTVEKYDCPRLVNLFTLA